MGAHRAVAHKLRRDDDAAVARTIRLLKSFVPGIVRADVAEQTATRVAKRTGAVLFADASGFTNLAEQMGADKDGVERLTSTLNAFFGVLIDIVHDHGGDIVQFSGDALTVLPPRGYVPEMNRGDAAAGTGIFRGDEGGDE